MKGRSRGVGHRNGSKSLITKPQTSNHKPQTRKLEEGDVPSERRKTKREESSPKPDAASCVAPGVALFWLG